MANLPDDPSQPISEDDRSAAVSRLHDVFIEGRISYPEMEDRLGQVATARTHEGLALAMVSLPKENAATTSTIVAAKGRIRRRGTWRVPRILRINSAFGRVSLDLSRAIINHAVVDIELQIGTGQVTIIVPQDAFVDFDDLRSEWKEVNYINRQGRRSGRPRIRITGTITFGRLKIRHARR